MPDFKLNPDDFEITTDEIRVISLHAPGIPSYKLAHFLNKNMNWEMCHTCKPYMPAENPKCELEVFSYVQEIDRIQWLLVTNRNQPHVWIPKLADVDYWLVLLGVGDSVVNYPVEDTLQKLSEIDIIFNVGMLPLSDPKNTGRKLPFFKYFQTLYNYADEAGIIRSFE